MRQQVNLLAPMFRKQRALFGAQVSLMIVLLFSAALGVIYGGMKWRGATLDAEQVRLESERVTMTNRLNDLAGQFQGKSQSHALDAQVQALSAERDRKAQALAALSRKELGNTTGFSPQFTGLARQRVGGLWLTHIEMAGSGGQMALSGVTLSEELIPKYLERLGSEGVFAGTAFEAARLQRKADGGNQLEFELRAAGASTPVGTAANP
jgi:hypothetical protein